MHVVVLLFFAKYSMRFGTVSAFDSRVFVSRIAWTAKFNEMRALSVLARSEILSRSTSVTILELYEIVTAGAWQRVGGVILDALEVLLSCCSYKPRAVSGRVFTRISGLLSIRLCKTRCGSVVH